MCSVIKIRKVYYNTYQLCDTNTPSRTCEVLFGQNLANIHVTQYRILVYAYYTYDDVFAVYVRNINNQNYAANLCHYEFNNRWFMQRQRYRN